MMRPNTITIGDPDQEIDLDQEIDSDQEVGLEIDPDTDTEVNTRGVVDLDLGEEVLPDPDPGHGREEVKEGITKEKRCTLRSMRIGRENIRGGQKGGMYYQDSAFGQNQ